MLKFEDKYLSYHFKFLSQEINMTATPASVEKLQKYVFNFKLYRFLQKRPIYPIIPYIRDLWAQFKDTMRWANFSLLVAFSPMLLLSVWRLQRRKLKFWEKKIFAQGPHPIKKK